MPTTAPGAQHDGTMRQLLQVIDRCDALRSVVVAVYGPPVTDTTCHHLREASPNAPRRSWWRIGEPYEGRRRSHPRALPPAARGRHPHLARHFRPTGAGDSPVRSARVPGRRFRGRRQHRHRSCLRQSSACWRVPGARPVVVAGAGLVTAAAGRKPPAQHAPNALEQSVVVVADALGGRAAGGAREIRGTMVT